MRTVAILGISLVMLGACADPGAVGSGEEVADTLEVRCDVSGTRIITPIVQAMSDGVHVLIRNDSDGEMLIQWDGGGDGAAPGISRQTLPIAPGLARFRCQPMTDDIDPGDPGGWAGFEVRPTAGWVSPDLDCGEGAVTGNIDYASGATGVADPSTEVQDRSNGAEVVQAGYATDDERSYIALVGTNTVATFRYFSDGAGGWLLMEHTRCS